jgi:hypothetical protein
MNQRVAHDLDFGQHEVKPRFCEAGLSYGVIPYDVGAVIVVYEKTKPDARQKAQECCEQKGDSLVRSFKFPPKTSFRGSSQASHAN